MELATVGGEYLRGEGDEDGHEDLVWRETCLLVTQEESGVHDNGTL